VHRAFGVAGRLPPKPLILGNLDRGLAGGSVSRRLLNGGGWPDRPSQTLGDAVRSAEALGCPRLVLPQRRNAGLTGSVAKVAAAALRASAGGQGDSTSTARCEQLKDEGYRVVGLAEEATRQPDRGRPRRDPWWWVTGS